MADQQIGTAKIVIGTVKAQSTDGTERVLENGSPIFLNDRLNTGADGAVSIAFTDAANTQLDLGRMTDMVVDESILGAEEVNLEEVTAEVEAIQQALESGEEIDIAETAAGPAAGSTGDGGGGRPVYRDSLDGKEGEITSGAETVGVDADFTGVLLDPVPEPETPVVSTPVVPLASSIEPGPEPEPVPVPEPDPDPDPDPELFPPVDYDVAVEANFFEVLPFSFAGADQGGEGGGGDAVAALPTSGAFMARLGAEGASQSELESFFNVASGVMDTLGNGNATDGSGIKTTVNVVAGDTVSFNWIFDSAEGSTFFNDFGFLVQEGAVVELADVQAVGGSGATTWATYSFTASSTGPLEIGFGVMNSVDTAVDSELIIDNLSVNGAPVESFESGDFTGWETIGDTAVVESHDEGGFQFGPGYLYEFQVGEADIADDNIRGTDVEDGVTTAFTITSLPTADGLNELGVLLIDRGDDTVIEEIYGDGFGDLPPDGLDVQSGDSVYYFLEQGTFEVLPESVSFDYFTTDSDGLVSDGAVITISFEDIPEAFPGTAAVDEDGLDGGNPGTIYADGSDLAGESASITGTLNYDFGDEGPNAFTPFTWSTSGLPGVTSAGAAVVYEVIDDGLQLVGHTGEISDPVLTLSLLDLDSREYELTVLKQLDHASADTEDDIVFNFGYTVMDGDGDTASSELTATVDDDSPTAAVEPASIIASVDESGLSQTTGDESETAEGNADNGADTARISDEDASGAGESIATLFSIGADQDDGDDTADVTYGFVVDGDGTGGLQDLNDLGLTSKGDTVNWTSTATTLTAEAGGRVILTVEIIPEDGTWSVDLDDQFDHAGPQNPGVENTELDGAASDPASIDLSAYLTATDYDGDTATGAAAGSFTLQIVDDVPELNGSVESLQVEEEGLDNFDAAFTAPGVEGSTGNEDETGAVEFVGDPGLTTASGSLSSLVDAGADEELTYGFVDDVDAALSAANGGLTSQDQELNYSVSGSTLTATSDDGRDIFTLEITDTSTGAYSFTLLDQLDHPAPPPGTAVENSLTLNLGAALQAQDNDGDAVNFGAIPVDNQIQDGVTVEVADDIPVARQVRSESIPQSMNLLLILDRSGSMNTNDRIGDLNDAVQDLFTGIGDNTYLAGAENVRVHVVSFNQNGSTVGTFDVKAGGIDQSAAWTPIGATGWTNYEDGLHEALQWVYQDWPVDLDPDTDGVAPDNVPPLTLPGTVNKVIFASDGLPNTFNVGADDNAGFDTNEPFAEALDHATGDLPGTDTVSELDALKAWANGGVEAVGIELDDLSTTAEANAIAVLNEISSSGTAINVELPGQLGPILGDLLPVISLEPIIEGSVKEDGLDTAVDESPAGPDGNDSADGNREAGESTSDDEAVGTQPDNNLNNLFNVGADEDLQFSLVDSATAESVLPDLWSNGEQLTYSVSNDDNGPDVLTAETSSGVVFTLTVAENGDWSFDLDGALDHVDNGLNDENTELVEGDGSPTGSVGTIDLSGVIVATDYDNDEVIGASEGAFVIVVEDDVPEAVDDQAETFGFSSTDGQPMPVDIFVLDNDIPGADNELTIVDAAVAQGGGSVEISAGEDFLTFTPDVDFSGSSEISYTVEDADGDVSTATVMVNERFLKVGTNADDAGGSGPDYVVGEGEGSILGGPAGDILIGDYGGSEDITQQGDVNLLFILDNSGSMDDLPDNRIEALKSSVNNVLTEISNGNLLADAVNVRAHIVTFAQSSNTVGTFDIKGFDGSNVDGTLAQAVAAVNAIPTGGVTNYEAGMQEGLQWIYTDAGPAAAGTVLRGQDAGGTLQGPIVVNQALFITDGIPNTYNNNAGSSVFAGDGAAITMDQILGTGAGSDSVAEVAELQEWGELTAVGIQINEGTPADNRLDLIDEPEPPAAVGDAVNVNMPIELESAIVDALVETEQRLADVGDDIIVGGEGDDLIYGDALFTDELAAKAGLATDLGSGWLVFEELEGTGGTGSHTWDDGTTVDFSAWTRLDTIRYIEENSAELGQESSQAGDPLDPSDDTREGGEDILSGDGGEDIIFGQEEDDTIAGGGEDDLLVGGTGADEIDGDAGSDLLVGDAIEITLDGPDSDTDPDAIDVVDDGAVDTLDGGADDDTVVNDQETTTAPEDGENVVDPGDAVIEGDPGGGDDPLLLLIDDTPTT